MTPERRSLLSRLFGAFKPKPLTVKATVVRTSLRPNGQNQASVEKPNGETVLILTPEKLTPGQSVKIRLAACGWELHQ